MLILAGEAEAGAAGEHPARNNQLRLIRTDERREWGQSLLPVLILHIGWIDLPCLKKTH
jgi:hypothetical protein